MPLMELAAWGSGWAVLLMTIVQVAPIKLNPWSAIARWVGKAINGDVLTKLDNLETRLEKHIKDDDERDADAHRAKILQFNNELLRDIPHTKEEFIEVMNSIDVYEHFCNDHPDYRNNRAVHAIFNIGRVYDDRLQKHDFLQDGRKEE